MRDRKENMKDLQKKKADNKTSKVIVAVFNRNLKAHREYSDLWLIVPGLVKEC